MNDDKSSMQKLEMPLEGGGNCFIEQRNSQAAGNKCKKWIDILTSPALDPAFYCCWCGEDDDIVLDSV